MRVTTKRRRCAERDPKCGCFIPRGAGDCLVHKKAKWKSLMEEDEAPPAVMKTAKQEKVIIEEEDLPPINVKPPPVAVAVVAELLDSKTAWAGLMSKMKPDAPKKKQQKVDPKKKPEIKPSWRDQQVTLE